MSRTSYYYDPPESGNAVDGEGACCSWCCLLRKIRPINEFVKMPVTAIDREYGDNESFMHFECALEALAEYKQIYEDAQKAVAKFENH